MDEVFAKILLTAERRYGPRCPGWDFQGIRFHSSDPELRYFGDSAVAIFLGDECRTDLDRRSYQLCHEVTHLLSPARGKTTVLAEGLAVDFAVSYTLDTRGALVRPVEGSNYQAAMHLYQRLQRLDYDIIKRMRQDQPAVSEIDANLIRKHFPRIDEDTAKQLAERFV